MERYPDVKLVTGALNLQFFVGCSGSVDDESLIHAGRQNMSHEKGLLHRLDHDTSGLVLVARTQPAFDRLLLQFSQDAVKKSYIAISAVDASTSGKPNDLFLEDWQEALRGAPSTMTPEEDDREEADKVRLNLYLTHIMPPRAS
jgi:23S rRNA-/tRNA-specific pseudouridylate synthase